MKSFSMLSATTAVVLAALSGSALAGDAGAGEKVFAKCKACHQVGETAKSAIGPELNGLDGRTAGSAPGYNYSEAMKSSGLKWDEATFLEYIKNPKAKVPGNKMVFQGISSDKDAGDLWAFLVTFGPDGKKK